MVKGHILTKNEWKIGRNGTCPADQSQSWHWSWFWDRNLCALVMKLLTNTQILWLSCCSSRIAFATLIPVPGSNWKLLLGEIYRQNVPLKMRRNAFPSPLVFNPQSYISSQVAAPLLPRGWQVTITDKKTANPFNCLPPHHFERRRQTDHYVSHLLKFSGKLEPMQVIQVP